ncbi:MAG: replicative DNA helicase [Myxococcales bacterium]|nr:replicative DNA helicase [Myxococcales bacterium]
MSEPSLEGKMPPHDLRAEAAVLGAILLDNEQVNKVVGSLLPEHFYRESHREIFQSMMELAERSAPIDLVTMTESLREREKLQAAGGRAYLVQLTTETPAAINVEHYGKIVRDKSSIRTMVDAARATFEEGMTDPGDALEFIERAQARIIEVTSKTIRTEVPAIREVLREAFEQIEKNMSRKEGVTGIPTGFADLDEKMSGLQPSDLIILAARPAMGKTAFALNVLANAALKSSVPAAMFSLEMSSTQLATRMLCTHAKVNATSLRKGQVSDAEWADLIRSLGPLSEANIFLDDTPALSILEMRARARRLHQERQLGLVVVDYLQLMRGSDLAARRSREQEISEISRGLKALAKELNLPVIALSQLNRGVESRTDKRPMMSDLRESGAIEQDADVVMFLYRDEYYHETSEKKGIAEVIIGKQRNGPTGTVDLKFTGPLMRFDNLARDYDDMGAPPMPTSGPF